MSVSPTLLRRRRRRGFRRLVFVGALALVLSAPPSAGSVPGDPTPPVVTPVYSPTLPANGWFRGSVTLSWLVVDPESIILNMTGCGVTTFTADTPGHPVTCSAESDGGIRSASVRIKLDRTPPTVTPIPERAADANGWYNRPVTVSFAGADATSGIASCSAPTVYGGPDVATASVSGTCTDNAGNAAVSATSFKYDATAPSLTGFTVTPGNRRVQLAWRPSSDTQVVELLRAPGRNGQGQSVIYRGRSTGYLDTGLTVGRKYEYRVTGIDEAANRSEHVTKVVATGALLSPAPAASISLKALPTLQWTPVKGARYYNVQLIRGHKVLSAWPVRPSFRLRRTWTYNRQRQRLRPGKYRWYVWSRSSRGFRLLGSSTFVVMK